MSWNVALDPERISLHVRGRISPADAARQERTAREILRRLAEQPGLVLADEVGMGKTFVAMTVAVCAAWAYPQRDPVMVMVPPSLVDKWPRDFGVFVAHCVRHPADREKLRAATARSGVELFRLLDDPPARRPRIVFLTHGALHRALEDPWVKLAILGKALRHRSLRDQRKAFPRFAARIMRLKYQRLPDELFAALMKAPHDRWRKLIAAHGLPLSDDPVPAAVTAVLDQGEVDLGELRDALGHLPLRDSARIKKRIRNVQDQLGEVLPGIWRDVLRAARFHSPLVILDEAHHLKNPATRLASLFVKEDADKEGRALQNALGGMFDRMLFLTATPFQLGHGELLNVLDRFRGIRWWPQRGREDFEARIEELRRALDDSRQASVSLDQKWARLTPDDLRTRDGALLDADAWWEMAQAGEAAESGRTAEVLRAYRAAHAAMKNAERLLRPWIIRHRRPRTLPDCDKVRRRALPGAGIQAELAVSTGLEITEDALLPFLLAARCEAVRLPGAGLARTRARATFAEGLASSYEAYLQTRAATGGANASELLDEDPDVEDAPEPDDLRWYLDQLNHALPDRAAHGAHPKVAATVERVLRLWEQGEKALIFCHFRETGNALQLHVSRALSRRLQALAEERSGLAGEALEDLLRRLGSRFEEDRPFHRLLRGRVDGLLATHQGLEDDERKTIFEIVRRFVRTDEFLIRYFPMDRDPTTDALEQALATRDESGLSLEDKLRHFVDFIAGRCESRERVEYLDALGHIQTGVRTQQRAGERLERLPNVRLVNGDTRSDQRRRIMLAFNTPFFPEILVASSVLAEGVDLHLSCRYVIHHDLSWNPSTLEQRTGRVDRIGAKAEVARESIHVYLPYIAATQDEKMYRVVRDRERWFQILMDESYTLDEHDTEAMAERVPLPEAAARALGFDLEVR